MTEVLQFFADAGAIGLIIVATGSLLWLSTRAVASLRSKRPPPQDVAAIIRQAVAEAFAASYPESFARKADLDALARHVDEQIDALRLDVAQLTVGTGPTTKRSGMLPPATSSTGGIDVGDDDAPG